MVISRIKRFFESQRNKLAERRREKESAESFKETEEMRKAEEMKRDADRLAQLKQYQTAIEEYNKAACHSYLDNFDAAISYFNNALQIQSAEDENKVRALMGKGSTYYRKKLFIEGRYRAGAYRISMDTDWEVSDKKI